MQWKVRNFPDPPPCKPPDTDQVDSLGIGQAVNIELESGERIMAQKSNKSQDTSTSLVLNTWLRNTSEYSKKKSEAVTMNQSASECRNSSLLLVADNSQSRSPGEVTEKVQWEPPCGRNLKQE